MPIKAVILDRDGTLIEHVPYLSNPALVHLLPGVHDGLAKLLNAGILLFLHTNQSGVGRGMFGLAAVHACNQRLIELLDLGPSPFTRICIAPEAPDAPSPYRKPSARFAREIQLEHSIAADQLCYIGDRGSDLATAADAGTLGIGLDTGLGNLSDELAILGLSGRYPLFPSFQQAVDTLLHPSTT